MATLRTKTIRYAFDTRITQLATNISLALATRHDFTAITLDIPENTSRTFLSVTAVVSYRDAYTAINELTAIRIGSKLGAAAFVDVDRTNAQANTGDHIADTWTQDLTDNFNTNFGGGTSQTCQIGVAIATTSAANVNSITCELWITYEYDDDVGTTRVATIGIPIQSHHTNLSVTHTEIGTTGGTTDAPANQIPALDTYLEESGKSYKQAFFVLEANDNGNTVTTDFTPFIQIDSTTEVARATIEQALITPTPWKDVFIYDTATHSTAAVHAFKMRSDLVTRMFGAGGILWVTYTYNKSTSTRVTCQQLIPFTQPDSDVESLNRGVNPSLSADPLTLIADFGIHEPGVITLKQSAIIAQVINQAGATVTYSIGAGAQTLRPYVVPSFIDLAIVQRGVHSSGWTVARGRNRLTMKVQNSSGQKNQAMNAAALVTYSADVPAQGTESKSRCAHFFNSAWSSTTAQIGSFAASGGGQRTPNLDADYHIQGVLLDGWCRATSASMIVGIALGVDAGEFDNDGIAIDYPIRVLATSRTGGGAEIGAQKMSWADTRSFNRTTLDSGRRMNIETARVLFWTNNGSNTIIALGRWITFNAIRFTVAGSVTKNGAAVANGKTVDILAKDAFGVTERVATTTTTGGAGAFTAQVPDDARTYWAGYVDGTDVGRSIDGTPGVSTFNIAMGGAPPRVVGSRVVRRLA